MIYAGDRKFIEVPKLTNGERLNEFITKRCNFCLTRRHVGVCRSDV